MIDFPLRTRILAGLVRAGRPVTAGELTGMYLNGKPAVSTARRDAEIERLVAEGRLASDVRRDPRTRRMMTLIRLRERMYTP